MNLPVPSTYAEVAAILRDMASLVEAGDSFEGSIEYSLPDVPEHIMSGTEPPEGWSKDDEPEVLVRAAYRIDNSIGQGGMRIIGSITATHPDNDPAPE